MDDQRLDLLLAELRHRAPAGPGPDLGATRRLRRTNTLRRRALVATAGLAATAAIGLGLRATLRPEPWRALTETVTTATHPDLALRTLARLRDSDDPRALAVILAAARAPAPRVARPPATTPGDAALPASAPLDDTVARTAAIQLVDMRVEGVADTLFRFLADTTVPLSRRQAALSRLQSAAGPPTLPMARVRALYPFLHGGSAHSTLFEVLVRAGDDGDREWVWALALRDDTPPLARLTALQLLGGRRSPATLDSLLHRTGTRLVRFGVLETLRDHRDPAALEVLRRYLAETRDPVMRSATRAAIGSR